jgi:PAS domain-containing protein
MSELLLPPRFLFQFSVPCFRRQPIWSAAGAQLDERYRLPDLSQLESVPSGADVRAAWGPEGLAFAVRVSGKRQPPWCRESRPDDSDGLRVWIDTRDTHNIHRATRFCHQFIFMPAGTGRGLDEPVAEQLLINRARENAKPTRPGLLQVRREKRVDGYVLEAFVPAAAMTGYDPQENPRLGFTYAIVDRELGEQTWSCASSLPFREDPSLWGTLELESEQVADERRKSVRAARDDAD